jgi:hypothetical protein
MSLALINMQSVSNVETTKTLMPAFAKGVVIEGSTPTAVNGVIPATRMQSQSRTQTTPSGTSSWRQTTESSSAVRVTEKISP